MFSWSLGVLVAEIEIEKGFGIAHTRKASAQPIRDPFFEVCQSKSPVFTAFTRAFFNSSAYENCVFNASELKKPRTIVQGFCFAEGEGFEPPVPLGTTVFKTAAFDHSANPLDQ